MLGDKCWTDQVGTVHIVNTDLKTALLTMCKIPVVGQSNSRKLIGCGECTMAVSLALAASENGF